MFKLPQVKKYHVYILYHTESHLPVYIGCSCSLKNRIISHKKSKLFDGVIILESFETKEEALQVERNLIKFVSMFNLDSVINALYDGFKKDTSFYQNQLAKIKIGIYG